METAIHTFFAANPALKGMLISVLTAVAVDLHAYSSGDGAFNWKKALTRYAGAALAGLGIGGAL